MENKENDAVFLSGKIHGCEHHVYIVYFNPNADNGIGSYEIEIIDAERVLKLYDEVDGCAEAFFDALPDLFHGEWKYCNSDSEYFKELDEAYPTADFLIGRDGGTDEELEFLYKWAKQATSQQ
jgi:hypothetical protein